MIKLFERTGGYWIFYISAAYLVGSLWSWIVGVPAIWLAPAYIVCLAMPFWLPPLGRSMNLKVDWDIKMLDWFRNYRKSEGSVAEDMSKVIKFPELKAAPPPVPEPEQPAKIFYRFGITDNNRLAFSMGYNEITMNKEGVQGMIDQLTFFRDQLTEDEQ
jgi:hypothetical protein